MLANSMMIFVLWLAFIAVIAGYSPQKKSLRDKTTVPLRQRFSQAKGTLMMGSLLCLIGLFTLTQRPGYSIQPAVAGLLGYSEIGFFQHHLLYQPITCIFMHFNLLHLFGNLSSLLLLAAYERRVGIKRYLTVYLVAGLASSFLEVLLGLVPGFQPGLSMGASGAICGLVAAYFLDNEQGHEALSIREWFTATAIIVGLILFMSFFSVNHLDRNQRVDWVAHLLGAVVASVYVRWRPFSKMDETLEEGFQRNGRVESRFGKPAVLS
jgi:membrane associated rhomboid family serine protease